MGRIILDGRQPEQGCREPPDGPRKKMDTGQWAAPMTSADMFLV
jgi:hypothetical protein